MKPPSPIRQQAAVQRKKAMNILANIGFTYGDSPARTTDSPREAGNKKP